MLMPRDCVSGSPGAVRACVWEGATTCPCIVFYRRVHTPSWVVGGTLSCAMFRKKSASNIAAPESPLPPPAAEEHAATVMQANIRGHLARKNNEEMQALLRKAKYRREMGWDKPPTPVAASKQTLDAPTHVEITPIESSRMKQLVEDIRKLTAENKSLKAKHEKLSKAMTREKRQRTKAEAEVIRCERKLNDSGSTIDQLKKELETLGKAKREAELKYHEAKKHTDKSIDEKAELILELNRAEKKRIAAAKAAKVAEREVERLSSAINPGNATQQRDARDKDSSSSYAQLHMFKDTEHKQNRIEDMMTAIKRLRQALEHSKCNQSRAEKAFRGAMELIGHKSTDVSRFVQMVGAITKDVSLDDPELSAPVRDVLPMYQTPIKMQHSTHTMGSSPIQNTVQSRPSRSDRKSNKVDDNKERRNNRQRIERENMETIRRKQQNSSQAATSKREQFRPRGLKGYAKSPMKV
jgi:hypothetical protein